MSAFSEKLPVACFFESDVSLNKERQLSIEKCHMAGDEHQPHVVRCSPLYFRVPLRDAYTAALGHCHFFYQLLLPIDLFAFPFSCAPRSTWHSPSSAHLGHLPPRSMNNTIHALYPRRTG